MTHPLPRSTQSKYRLWAVNWSLVLSISLPLDQIQVSSDSLYIGKEVKPIAGVVRSVQKSQQIRQLEQGIPIEQELAGSQSHSYQVTLTAGQYVKVAVDQRGIDVMVKLIGPDGKQITQFDSELRTQGQEIVSWVAEGAGSYRLDVVAKYKNAAGKYEIQVVELRVATSNDRALHEASKLNSEARRLYSAGKYHEARTFVGRVLEIRERVLGPDHFEVARTLNVLALIHYFIGEHTKAEPLFQRALVILEKERRQEHPDFSRTLNNLGNLYKQLGNYAKAEPLYLRALTIAEKALGPEHPDVAASLNNLAILYTKIGDYEQVEQFYQRALAVAEKVLGPEHPDLINSLNNLANLYSDRGDYVKPELLYQRALTIAEKALEPEHPDVADALNNLANLYSNRGDYGKAEPLYRRALTITEKVLGPEHSDVGDSLNNLANLYSKRGAYAKAEPLYLRALTIAEKALGPEHPDVARVLNNLAPLYSTLGIYAKAEPLYLRALTIREKALGKEHPNLCYSLNNLANLYYERGDYVKAEPLYERALAIREKALGLEHPDVAQSLNNLALLFYEIGDYGKAEPLYRRALTIREKALGPEHPDVGEALNNFALLYRDKGDYAKAEPLFERALTIREKALGPEHRDVGYSLNSLANLYRMKGNYAKAEPLFQRALAIVEKALGPEHPKTAESLYYLAVFHATRGDVSQAVAFLSRANAVDERNFALNLAIGSERQKLAYLDIFSKWTDFTLSLQSRVAPNDPQALNLAFTTLLRRKGRGLDAMTDTIATFRRHATPQDQELLDQLADARSQLAALTLKEPDTATPDTYRKRLKLLEDIEDEVEKLEAELSSRSADFRAQTQPVTLTAVQAALPAGSTLVEFAVYSRLDPKTEKSKPPRYLAYLLTAQGQPKWVDLGEAALIDRAVDAWRKALRDPNRIDVKRRARAVDERVMRPVRSLLSKMPGDTRRLLIAPDGSLNLIPFAALVDERNRYLVERHSISYLTSGRDLLRLQTSEPSKNAPLVVANPLFGSGETVASAPLDQNPANFPTDNQADNQPLARNNPREVFFQALPGTRREALAIKAVLPEASLLLKEDATEAALKQARAPSILHIATHGFFLDDQEAPPPDTRSLFSDNPLRISDPRSMKWAAEIENPLLRSGLALAGVNQHRGGDDDGLLTALEAASLNLWGTKLVVLSACDTGIGKVKNGEGVYGLRRALVLAGSQTQVISLWPVSDRETRGLMAGYYKRLRKGEGRAEALRQIQLEMLKDIKLRHPYYWASFIQAGEWANLDGRR